MKLLLRRTLVRLVRCSAIGLLFLTAAAAQAQSPNLAVNDSGYLEKRGLNVLVFSNRYGLFGDEKASGVEIIHHEVRTATNGDVRLNPTPEQWDSIPQFVSRRVSKADNSIEAFLHYPAYGFAYSVKVKAAGGGAEITVNLDKPLPAALVGVAGFNLEFLPAAYFRKTYLADGAGGVFPLYPSSDMRVGKSKVVEPLPIATGRKLVLAPEDPVRRVTVQSGSEELMLFDGRAKAQNGWFVVRSLIPAGKTGAVIKWTVSANTLPNWMREPMIAYSQVGYHPAQKKVAVIELDKADKPLATANLLRVKDDGSFATALSAPVKSWGPYLRYRYAEFDFSAVRDSGVYVIEYGRHRTTPFRIGADVYRAAWHPTLDVYFPVAMDHMFVNEAYRVWHGRSHLDDALQAPTNHLHFDLYAQGPTTGNRFQPFEHIPGLAVGGWYDAGDFDIRTQTIYAVVQSLAHTWETFRLTRDQTTVNQQTQYVDLHVPDGKPDLLQQVEHGVLQLLAQHKAVGYAINGIVEAHLSQYTHLGDAVTKTDNLVYNAKMDSLQTDGLTSGTFDDRWAFTNRSSPLNYGSAAALAAAARVLRGYNDTLAAECLQTAVRVWNEEHSRAPDLFVHGNTTGGPLLEEELKAAVELLATTQDDRYAGRIAEIVPVAETAFARYALPLAQAVPFMNAAYRQRLAPLVKAYRQQAETIAKQNPFGVPVTRGGWAGSGAVLSFATTAYYLHKTFPEIMDAEGAFRGLNFLYGCHPGSNLSLVSGVGTRSKEVAYGNNRADYSFIAGGVVPGVLILPPDFPENKEDWPFLWGENEYVVNVAAGYLFLVNAVAELAARNSQVK